MNKFIFAFILGVFLSLFYWFWKYDKNSLPIIQSLKPKTKFSIEQAPKDSLKGTIQSLSGLVKWESRVATESVVLKKETQIQQGENLLTDENSGISLNFDNQVIVDITSRSAVSVIQTLPINFVFSQASGSAEYKKLGQIPISIRSFNLIMTIDGETKLSVDNQTGLITIKVKKGTAKLGFNDLQYISQVVEVKEGQTYIFDDTKREGEIKE